MDGKRLFVRQVDGKYGYWKQTDQEPLEGSVLVEENKRYYVEAVGSDFIRVDYMAPCIECKYYWENCALDASTVEPCLDFKRESTQIIKQRRGK